MARYDSPLDLIGNTPLVDVSTTISPNPNVKILAKLEGQNPGGSVKDRIALSMVEAAERAGDLKPGQTIIESSSGNTGIGLALVATVKGYPIKIVLPENVSVERKQLLEVWGAEIISTPGAEGSNGAMRHAQKLARENPDYWYPFQYGNQANPKAHYEGTGPEIYRDAPEVTHFVAGLGTAGTIIGIGTYLKEQNPLVQVWAIEPPLGEMVDGLKNFDEGFVPPVFLDGDGYELVDRKKAIGIRESLVYTRKLRDAGVFAGISSGAVAAGAAKCADDIDEGTVVIVIADGGWKYLSTGAWTDDIDAVVERARR
ncbi:MAG: [CysO sulfur-carrier protein]-thiocarboxylate-dependent cysteine synthase, partial [Actinomycetota bacterium]|nr:[CysO sulfur-carrier protein]-thiocarboxylate-dependent cysteine synthase [Actinomycetota bacterium]